MTEQLPLPLRYMESVGAHDFFVSDCNAKAVTWLDRYPAWGNHATLLLGPSGSGKSHLAAIFAARHGAGVEVVDPALSDSAEVALFHRFNAAKEGGRGLLMVAREPPVVRLPDLASRLGAMPIVRIEAPDEAVLGAVMIKAARDRGLTIPPEVLRYALTRLERRFAAVHDFVAVLDAASLADRREITIPLAAQLLPMVSPA